MTPKHNKGESASEPTQNPMKINVDYNKLFPRGAISLCSDKKIEHLSYSAGGKARYGLHRLVGIDIQKDFMHFPTCHVNLCVLCYFSFHYHVYIVKINVYISTRYKRA